VERQLNIFRIVSDSCAKAIHTEENSLVLSKSLKVVDGRSLSIAHLQAEEIRFRIADPRIVT
jgi:hypothetical protein